MVGFRRLDPLANASPYFRLTKSPVKSLSLTEAQYDRIRAEHPELIVAEARDEVLGHYYRDFFEVHYGFQELNDFMDHFEAMFTELASRIDKDQAPRGILLSFRDRPNRPVADQIFWELALDQGPQWVEMNLISTPEQPMPGDALDDDYELREVAASDLGAIAEIDAEASGMPRLSAGGVESIKRDARLFRVVVPKSGGSPAGYVSLHTEPGGWGIIEALATRGDAFKDLGKPMLDWSIAWLRNNGGRRIRKHVYIDGTDIPILREAGFTGGESGIDFMRPSDLADVSKKKDERKAHGTVIKFGDWR